MAKTKNQVEEIETDELEDEETTSAVRPKDLAEELDISPKALRNYLRKEFPRAAGEKNTSWVLTEAQIEAARARFSESEEDEEDTDSDEE